MTERRGDFCLCVCCFQGDRGFDGLPGLPGNKGHRVTHSPLTLINLSVNLRSETFICVCVCVCREIRGRRGQSVLQEALEKKSVNISSIFFIRFVCLSLIRFRVNVCLFPRVQMVSRGPEVSQESLYVFTPVVTRSMKYCSSLIH